MNATVTVNATSIEGITVKLFKAVSLFRSFGQLNQADQENPNPYNG